MECNRRSNDPSGEVNKKVAVDELKAIVWQEVRDDALHMLGVLSMRVWKEGTIAPRTEGKVAPGGASPPPSASNVAVVVGNLQDTYQQFQFQVSAKLARWASFTCLTHPCVSSHHSLKVHGSSSAKLAGALVGFYRASVSSGRWNGQCRVVKAPITGSYGASNR